MKRKLLLKVFLSIVFVSGFFSCTDYFSPDLTTQLPDEAAYKDFLSSRAAVNGLYTGLQNLMSSYVVVGELRGDMLRPNAAASQDLMDIYNLSIKPDNSYLPYRNSYGLIHSCNDVIQHLNTLREVGTTYDEELDNMYAEAVLVRTWVYFFIYRNYNEAPYIVSSYNASASELPVLEWIEENSQERVTLAALESDLQIIIPLFDPTKISETEFFNLSSAYALLGDMYLWENQYEDAVEALLSSINIGNGYRFILDRDLENNKWLNIFKGDETATDEIMTKIIFDKGEKQENELLPLFAAHAIGGNQLDVVDKFANKLVGTYRFDGTFKGGLFVGKYTRSDDDPYSSDMPVILYRAADVHLLLAEAYNRLGEFNIALDILNRGSDSLFTAGSKGIRGRVALDNLQLNSTDPTDKIIELEDMILQERSMELAFEGKRWYDILRVGKRRMEPNYIANMILERFENPDSVSVRDYFSNTANWYLPEE